jgi:hypothetical protein
MSGGPELPKQLEARRGLSLSYKGKTLLSLVDPIAQAERTAQTFSLQDRTLYLCPSPLYGYGLETLLAKLEKEAPHSALLCIEAEQPLYELSLEHFSLALNDNPRLRFTNLKDGAGLCAFVRQAWGARSFRRVETIRLSGGWRLCPELYDSLAGALRRDISVDWGNALTLAKLGRLYVRNALRNLVLLPHFPSIAELSFGGDPVLVLGAGPSLDGLLEGLAACFGKALKEPKTRPFRIICVDTCLPALGERNIRPDLAVILESQHWNLRDFVGSRGRDIPAALDLSALPATGKILSGGLYLFMTPWTELSIFKRLGAAELLPTALLPLGSVGLTAVELARRLSSGPVITGGIDFSFTLDTYHARSTPGHTDKLRRQNRFRRILNADAAFGAAVFSAVSKSGDQVRSSPAMRNYRDLFEQEFANDPRLFDISGPGLPLGIKTLDSEGAFGLLAGGGRGVVPASFSESDPAQKTEKLKTFLAAEQDAILSLRDILTGDAPADGEKLEQLLDTCDYLWAHFPDCAGAGGRRPSGTDLAFLKRVRAEIDPFLKLFRLILAELQSGEC